tara:strand:+ start:266 stop:724 length:459 start_codon:yes stop_codon:yes gene_type:complete
MTVTTVTSSKFISDPTILVRDFLRDNVTDPISSTRQTTSKFVMTSYPQRPVQYPIITILSTDFSSTNLGMRSTNQQMSITLEIRVWGRNEKEKDEIAQEVHDELRGNQFQTTGPSEANNLHNFDLVSSVNVDEDGQRGIKSKVMTYKWFAIL